MIQNDSESWKKEKVPFFKILSYIGVMGKDAADKAANDGLKTDLGEWQTI